MLRVVFFAALICMSGAAAAQGPGFPDAIRVPAAGTTSGRVHFDDRALARRSLTGDDVARIAASVLAFHARSWNATAPLFWDIYIAERRRDGAFNFGASTFSTRRKVAGATGGEGAPCVTLLAMEPIGQAVGSNDDRFETKLKFVMAHEAAHCFQRLISKPLNETIAYSHADWFMEGSASWLAGNYLESEGIGYPSYFEAALRQSHHESLMKLANANHFFFKWLSGSRGVGNQQVMALLRAMLNVPPAGCTAQIPTEIFPDERKRVAGGDCEKIDSPYAGALRDWFGSRGVALDRILALFGSAIVRGDVPGIRAPNLFLKRVTIPIKPGFNAARNAAIASGAILPAPLGKVKLFSAPGAGKPTLPEPLGFQIFDIQTSEPIILPPSAYDFAVEDGGSGSHVLLSGKTSDTTVDASGWVRAKFLDGSWVTAARSSPKAGEKAHLLLRAVP